MIKPTKILRTLSVILFITTLSSCMLFLGTQSEVKKLANVEYPSNETLWFITECDSIEKNNNFGYQNIRFQTYTFSTKTLVYCSPIENSREVDTISVNTEVRGRRTISYNNVFWLEIFHEGKTKYIKRDDTRLHGYFFSKNNILLGKKNDSIISIKVIDLETNNEFDSYDFEAKINKKNEDTTATYFIGNTRLVGLNYLIRHKTYIDEKYKNIIINEFILIDTRKQFAPLLKSKSFTYKRYYLKDNYLKESIYIPCRFQDEKILLVENGDLDNIFDKETGELNVIDCPEKFKKFEENLIVKRIESQFQKTDEEGEPMYDEEGDEIWVRTKDTIYYQWNGTKLVEVK